MIFRYFKAAAIYGVMLTAFVGESVPTGLEAQATVPRTHDQLTFEPLQFQPSGPEEYQIGPGVTVFLLEDHHLPLVSIFARFRGGPVHFSLGDQGPAVAVPILLRSGGTLTLPPDSVDKLLEFYSVETSFGRGGRTAFTSMNTLTRHLDIGLDIWSDLIKNPAFDLAQVEVWRGQELDNLIRRKDDPTRLAVMKFNNLIFGDHPLGWELTAEDLEPDNLTPEILHRVHRMIFCPENLTLGITGDVAWTEIRPKLERMFDRWPPCEGVLEDPPLPTFPASPGVYVLPKNIEQSTIIIGKPSDVQLTDDSRYFSSRIGNSILGGSGLTSRLASRIRTQEGLAYSAASIWTTPVRSNGIIGAVTQTKSETTVAALRLITEILGEMSSAPPEESEIRDVVSQVTNSFVFNFQSPATIVSRQMLYLSQNLPLDWLSRYLKGIQGVTSTSVHEVFRDNVPLNGLDEMVILIVGDPNAFDLGLDSFGPIQVLDTEDREPDTSGDQTLIPT